MQLYTVLPPQIEDSETSAHLAEWTLVRRKHDADPYRSSHGSFFLFFFFLSFFSVTQCRSHDNMAWFEAVAAIAAPDRLTGLILYCHLLNVALFFIMAVEFCSFFLSS